MKKKKKTSNTYPQVDESEFLQIVENISKKLGYRFKFGYHNYEDMKQQISVFALEGLKNYDHKRPLENFLWTHVRNRLFNYKRDNYQRPNKPCYTCPLFKNSTCTKYANKNDCDLYYSWANRNQNKKNLMHLTTIDEIKDFGNIFVDRSVENSEIIDIIEQNINGEERSIYLRLKFGEKINKTDMLKLVDKLKEILHNYG